MSFADLVRERTATTGTGALTLIGAATGYRTFAAAAADPLADFQDGDTCTICISTGTERETCDAVFTAPSTLSRGTLRASTTGARLNLTGISTVSLVQVARDIEASKSKWQRQAAWYIDWVAGDDQNDGATAESAVKTQAEAWRRTGGVFDADRVDIYILSSSPEVQNWIFRDRPAEQTQYFNEVYIHGARRVLGTGTITTSQACDPSTRSDNRITVDSLPVSWTSSGFVGKFLRRTNGSGLYTATVETDLGSKTARICGLYDADAFSSDTFAPGDTFEAFDLPIVLSGTGAISTIGRRVTVYFDELTFGTGNDPHQWYVEGDAVTTFRRCHMICVDVRRTGCARYMQCRLTNCRTYDDSRATILYSAIESLFRVEGGHVDSIAVVATCSLQVGVSLPGSRASMLISGTSRGTAIFGGAVIIGPNGYVLTGNFSRVWGTGAVAEPIIVMSGGRFYYDPALPPNFDTTVVNVGGDSKALAELPYANAANLAVAAST